MYFHNSFCNNYILDKYMAIKIEEMFFMNIVNNQNIGKNNCYNHLSDYDLYKIRNGLNKSKEIEITIEIGCGLLPLCIDKGSLLSKIRNLRKELSFELPRIVIKDNMSLKCYEYRIKKFDKTFFSENILREDIVRESFYDFLENKIIKKLEMVAKNIFNNF